MIHENAEIDTSETRMIFCNFLMCNHFYSNRKYSMDANSTSLFCIMKNLKFVHYHVNSNQHLKFMDSHDFINYTISITILRDDDLGLKDYGLIWL